MVNHVITLFHCDSLHRYMYCIYCNSAGPCIYIHFVFLMKNVKTNVFSVFFFDQKIALNTETILNLFPFFLSTAKKNHNFSCLRLMTKKGKHFVFLPCVNIIEECYVMRTYPRWWRLSIFYLAK